MPPTPWRVSHSVDVIAGQKPVRRNGPTDVERGHGAGIGSGVLARARHDPDVVVLTRCMADGTVLVIVCDVHDVDARDRGRRDRMPIDPCREEQGDHPEQQCNEVCRPVARPPHSPRRSIAHSNRNLSACNRRSESRGGRESRRPDPRFGAQLIREEPTDDMLLTRQSTVRPAEPCVQSSCTGPAKTMNDLSA